MASSDESASFETSLQILVKYLQQNLPSSGKETLKIPEPIIKPFKRISQPQATDSSLVRPLLNLFDGSNYHRADRLDPPFFSGLVSIVFHLPYSIAQEKLLYAFMQSINAPQSPDRDERNHAIAKRLLHVLLKRLVGDAVDKRLRWVAAQFIASFLDKASSSDRLGTYPECQHLRILLASHEDYVTRFLIADLVRLHCEHGATIAHFFPHGTATQTILGFPQSENRDVAWLRNLQDFFSDLDATTSFTGSRQSAFRVLNVNYDNQPQPDLDGSVAVITDRLLLLSASGNSCLHLASIPLLRSSQTSAAIPKENHTVLEIAYTGDSGYQLRNGTKRALSNVSLCFGSEDDAAAALDSIRDIQELDHVTLEPPAATTPAMHRSIAFLNIWTAENDSSESDVVMKETQVLPTGDEVPSPLQHISQHCSEGGKPSDIDDDTASESSFLEGQRDKRSLVKRFTTAQDSIEQGSRAQAFTKAADTAVGRSRSRSRIRPEAVAKPVEGAVEVPPHLPSKRVNTSRPFVPIFQDSLISVPKGPRADSASAFDPAPLPPVLPVKQPRGLSERRPLATKTNNKKTTQPRTKATGGSPSATKIVGPMARLTKKDTQSSTGLKRKAQTQDGAGDESFRDETSFDLPEDSSHDERQQKKFKIQERKTAGKKQATTKHKARPTKSEKQPKPSKSPKKALSKPAARLSTENVTLAATRSRRAANKTATYKESSPNDNDPVSDNERTTTPDVSLTKAPASKQIRKAALLQSKIVADNSPLRHISPAHDTIDIRMAPKQGLPARSNGGKQAPTDITVNDHQVDADDMNLPQAELVDGDEENIAQDSYPTATLTKPSPSKPRTSFGTSLTTMLHSTSAKKVNRTTRPTTPFGNESQFVRNVNAAKGPSPAMSLSLQSKSPLEVQVINLPELDNETSQAMEDSVPIICSTETDKPCKPQPFVSQVLHVGNETFPPVDPSPSQRAEANSVQRSRIDSITSAEDDVDQLAEPGLEQAAVAHDSVQLNKHVDIIQPRDDNPDPPAEAAYVRVVGKFLDPPTAPKTEAGAIDEINPDYVAEDTFNQKDPQKDIQSMQTPAPQPAHSRTSFILFPPGEASVTRPQPQPTTRPNENSLQSSDLLAESVLSENDEGTHSNYEESENEEATQSQDNSENFLKSAVLPATLIADPAVQATATRRRSSPDIEDEEPPKPAVKSRAQSLKLSSRTSIGLRALAEKNFPEAETTILPAQSKPMKPKMSKIEGTVVQIASPPINPTDMTAKQALMPPPKKVASVSRASTERQPLRLRPTDFSPIQIVGQAFAHSPTPVPLHLRFERHLKNVMADLEGNRSEAPQRTSYATDDSADPTLVARRSSDQYFRRRVRSISLSSNGSMTSSCRGEELVTRDDPDSDSFLGLQKSIHDVFWQVAEESLLCLRTEQGIIEKEVESFETVSMGASAELQNLWAKKICHEGLKVREQLDNIRVQLEDAAERMGEEKNWWTMLRAEDMEADVNRRGAVTMHALQILQKSISI